MPGASILLTILFLVFLYKYFMIKKVELLSTTFQYENYEHESVRTYITGMIKCSNILEHRAYIKVRVGRIDEPHDWFYMDIPYTGLFKSKNIPFRYKIHGAVESKMVKILEVS